MLDNSRVFYTYILIRPYNMIPAYVGKGKDGRFKDHEIAALNEDHSNRHLQNVILKAHRLGMEMLVEFPLKNTSAREALDLEIELIAKIGRADLKKGPLCNKTDGGDGVVNPIITEEFRQKMREIGLLRKQSEKTKKKLSDIWMGHVISQETRIKISKSLTGKTHSEETKQKMRDKRQGKDHPMFGRKHSEETKEYWSITRKGKIHSEEEKQKIREGVIRNWEIRRARKLTQGDNILPTE